jgi:3-dehydroquinate dehydratase-1
LICTPLVGRLKQEVFRELAVILPKHPDVIEWRIDHFRNIADLREVLEVARHIREASGPIPIIIACRSASEGGESVPLDHAGVVALHSALCENRLVDIIDYELHNPPEHGQRLREASRANGVEMILSYHNFQATPDAGALYAKFAEAERCGADIAKVAVMPRSPEDVLTLLGATWRASESLGIPVIGMSMGGLGAVSRMMSSVFGSALTFAVGVSSSAPGQIPIEELRAVLETVRIREWPVDQQVLAAQQRFEE